MGQLKETVILSSEIEEEKVKNREHNSKRFLGFLSLLPYIIIGFSEMYFPKFVATENFKTNMMYLAFVGLFYFFNRELTQLGKMLGKFKKEKSEE